MPLLIRFTAILAPFLLGLAAARAQDNTGTITGHVVDVSTEAHLAGAAVILVGPGTVAIVEHDGTFELRGIPAGNWSLNVSYLGYTDQSLGVTVVAGQTVRLDAALRPAIANLQPNQLEGARESQARAINQQLSATIRKNIVAADAIGNFPDVNAAEAVKRLPGISTVRQHGEDRDITIRGAAPNLNAITVDGVSVLSNQVDGRTVSLDVFPAEQLAGVEITKSVLPDQDADSIGGAINLRTKSAFDARGRVLAVNGFWQYNDLAAQSSYRTGVNFSNVIGAEGHWGLQLSVSRDQRRALEETVEPAGWDRRIGAAANGGYAGFSPDSVPFTYADIKRERTGGSFSLERKSGPSSLLYLRTSYNESNERNARSRFVVQHAGAIGAASPVTIADGQLTAFTSTTARGQRVVNPSQLTVAGSSVALGGRALLNEWKLGLVGSLARGTSHQDSVTGQWETAANTTATFNLTDSERPIITRIAGVDLYDPSAYAFSQLQVQDGRLRNCEYAVKGDASRELVGASGPLRLSTGFKFRWSPRKWDQETQPYNSPTSSPLALNDARFGGAAEVKSGFLHGQMPFGPSVSPYLFYDFARANLSLFGSNPGATLQDTLPADYYVSEGIGAGYLMGEWTRGTFTALGGVRYEHTKTVSKGYRQNTALPTTSPARYAWVRHDSGYHDLLPGFHLRYAPRKKLVLRASWNNTLARPQTNRISPSLDVTTPAAPSVSDPVIVSGGNPNLRATTSANLDFSAEYYLKAIGLISAGYFRKQLEGPVYRRTSEGAYEGKPARFTVFENAGRARLSGWEFIYQHQLGFLPGPFDALGLYANYTTVDSEVVLTEPGRVGEKVPLFNQSDQLGNVALTYQKHGVFVRLSHHWRGDYLVALATAGLDQYARGFESNDLLASYKLSAQWTVKLEATNLGAAPEQQYAGAPQRNIYYGDTGRSYALGVVLNF